MSSYDCIVAYEKKVHLEEIFSLPLFSRVLRKPCYYEGIKKVVSELEA